MDIHQAKEREKLIKERKAFIEANPGQPLEYYAAPYGVEVSTIKKDIVSLHKKHETYTKSMRFETWIPPLK